MMMYEKGQASILIVDEDSGDRKKWKEAFESASFWVLEAGSLVDALAYLGNPDIDILLVGALRDDGGAQLAVQAHEVRPALPIMIVAWAASPVGVQDRLAILLEPVSEAELIGAARTLLSQ